MTDHRDAPTTGSGVTRYVLATVVLGVVFVILAVQNSATTSIDLFFWTVRPPLYGVVAVSALFGAAAAEVTAGMWRHRRHLRNRDRLELSHRRDAGGVAPPPPAPA